MKRIIGRIMPLILVLILLLTGCDTVTDIVGSDLLEQIFGDEIVLPDGGDGEESDNRDEPYDTDDNAHTHNYVAVTTLPTCDEKGNTTYTCDACGASFTAEITNALGHSYNAVVTEPTLESNGYTTYTCDRCGDSYVSDIVGSLKHTYETVVTPPTCENAGYTTYVCTSCGFSYTSGIVAPLGHTETVKKGYAATCTEYGLSDGKVCCNCNVTIVAQTTIAPLGHRYGTAVTPPTCENAGYTTHTCTTCGDTFVTDTVAPLGHRYGTAVTPPTCENVGYTTYTCTSCGFSYTSGIVAALGHTETVKKGYAATCTESGLSDGKACSTCKITIVAQTAIAPLGHTWQEATTEAPKTCIVCFITEGEKLPSGDSSDTVVDTLYVNYIDVGQGDSIFIKVGDCDILIDAGTANYGSTVSNYLKKQGVDDIELMINTHPDADHCGGLTQVLKDFSVEAVWASPLTKTTNAFKNFDSAVKSEGLTRINPAVGTVYTYEILTLTVLYNGAGTSDSNDSSIVVMLEYGSYKFLFTGDISSTIENKLVNNSSIDLSCDVLKVAHHGSRYSSSAAFLRATGADYGVICVGAGNSYGHPTSDALNRLSNAGISIYRTDLNGDVVFSTDGYSMTLPGGSNVSRSSSGGSNALIWDVESEADLLSVNSYKSTNEKLFVWELKKMKRCSTKK